MKTLENLSIAHKNAGKANNIWVKTLVAAMFIVFLFGTVSVFAASQVPVIQSITIPADRVDSGLTITLTNVFDIFTYEGPDSYGSTVTVFYLDIDGTVSFNQDISGLWGMRFIADRRGLHPAYGGIDFSVRAGEQIIMSELEGFIWSHPLDQHNTDHIFDFATVRTDEPGRTLADKNARIEAPGSTSEIGRVSELVTETQVISDWATEQVHAAIVAGLVPFSLQSGYTQPATRAEFAALAVALYETATDREVAIDRSIVFIDTMDINVHKAATLGIVGGVGENRFAPDDNLTREQAAVMLARLATVLDNPLPTNPPTFADNNLISTWAINEVGQMQASSIMGGLGDNRFDPTGIYTREQSIVTIWRLYDLLN